jgi:hypothetical protein
MKNISTVYKPVYYRSLIIQRMTKCSERSLMQLISASASTTLVIIKGIIFIISIHGVALIAVPFLGIKILALIDALALAFSKVVVTNKVWRL